MNKNKVCFFQIFTFLIVYVKCVYSTNIPFSSNEKKELNLFKDILFDNKNDIEHYFFLNELVLKLKDAFNIPNYDLDANETSIESFESICDSLKELYIEILRNFVYNENNDQKKDLTKYSNILKKFLKKIYYLLSDKKRDDINIDNDTLRILIIRFLSSMNNIKNNSLKDKNVLKLSKVIVTNYALYIANQNKDIKDVNEDTNNGSETILTDNNLNVYKKNILIHFSHNTKLKIFFSNINTLSDLTKMFYKFYTHFTNKKVIEKEVNSIKTIYLIDEILKIIRYINTYIKDNGIEGILNSNNFCINIQNSFKNICEIMPEELQIGESKYNVIEKLTIGFFDILKDIYKDNKYYINLINKEKTNIKRYKENYMDGFEENKKLKLIKHIDSNEFIAVFNLSNEMLCIDQQHFTNIKKLQHILIMCLKSEKKKHILDNIGIENIKFLLFEYFKKEIYNNLKLFFQFIKKNFDYLNKTIYVEKKRYKLSPKDYIENDKLLDLLEKVMNFDKRNNAIYLEKLYQFKNIMECFYVSISMNLENEKNPIVLYMKMNDNNNYISIKIDNNVLENNDNNNEKKKFLYRDNMQDFQNLLNTSEINSSFIQIPQIYKIPLYQFTNICDKRKEKSPSGNWIRYFSEYNETLCLILSNDKSTGLFPALVRSLIMNKIDKNIILNNIISEYKHFLQWYFTNIKSKKEKYLNVGDLSIFSTMYKFKYFPKYSSSFSSIHIESIFPSYIKDELEEFNFLKNEPNDLDRKGRDIEKSKSQILDDFFSDNPSAPPPSPSDFNSSTPFFRYSKPSAVPLSASFNKSKPISKRYLNPNTSPLPPSDDYLDFLTPLSFEYDNSSDFIPTPSTSTASTYTSSTFTDSIPSLPTVTSTFLSEDISSIAPYSSFDSPYFSHSPRSQFKFIRPYDIPPSSNNSLYTSIHTTPTNTTISTPINTNSPDSILTDTPISTNTPTTDTIFSTPYYPSDSNVTNTTNLNESHFERYKKIPKHRSSIRAYKVARKSKEKARKLKDIGKTQKREKNSRNTLKPIKSASFESMMNEFADKFKKIVSTSHKKKNEPIETEIEPSKDMGDNENIGKTKLKVGKNKVTFKLDDSEINSSKEPASNEENKDSFQFPKETVLADVHSYVDVDPGFNYEVHIYENIDGKYEDILKDVDKDGFRTYEQLVISELLLPEGIDINEISPSEREKILHESESNHKSIVVGIQLCNFPYQVGDFIKLYDMEDMIKHITKLLDESNKNTYFILKSNSYLKNIKRDDGVITKSVRCISKNNAISAYSIWNNEFHISNYGMILKTQTLEEKALAYYIERIYMGSNSYLYNDDVKALQDMLKVGFIIFEDGEHILNEGSSIYGNYKNFLLLYYLNEYNIFLANHIELHDKKEICHTGYEAKDLPDSLKSLMS
ncbi:conserved Plasmodium protein, unknown function [Plasmodium gallinaceum]|uniref:Uncharacterized protein n=1 Tax=Plasmodium gallinaceum TaxID=5849 RepID=A0A1J1GS05_PLAGA|nr:conserved Plasmodium protein, unknown function [Plasmodium gallinaceum]CRG95211.1 conserved Plasmodium protein, unknown function [Plasmodium gallinaceum]